jgi:hypothetical protein
MRYNLRKYQTFKCALRFYFFARRVLAGMLLRRRARRRKVARGLAERAAGLRVLLPQVRS